MSEGVVEVPLPLSVERLIEEIRVQLLLPMPDVAARKALSKIGEEAAIDVLRRISTSKRIQNFSGFIMYMVNKYASLPWGEAESIRLSTPPSSICSSPPNAGRSAFYDSPTSKQFLESRCSCKVSSPVIDDCHAPMNSSPQIHVQQQNSAFSCSSLKAAIPASTIQNFSYGPSASHCSSPVEEKLFAPVSPQRPMNSSHGISVQLQTSALSCTSLKDALPTTNVRNVSYGSSASHHGSPVKKKLFAPTSPPTPNCLGGTSSYEISQQSLLLSELEFRKLFMVLSYIGSNKLEDAISVEDAINIKSMKTIPMLDFEDWMWSKFGCRYCQPCDRAMYLDWDSGKTHLYSCYVSSDGGYQFKGPHLDAKKTHLQRAIGDENVLIVKFAEATDMGNMMTNASTNYEKIAEAGILVGLRRYRFFVFKDGGKERQKKGKEDKRPRSSGAVKCYFVPRESIAPWDDRDTFLTNYKTTHDVRCLFMHVHTVSSLAKYMARFSLILSTTIKLQVDLASVLVEKIGDIACIDERGCIVHDEDGEEQIHTDGTGFISENLAVLVPDNFSSAMYLDDNANEKLGLVQAEIASAGLRGKEALYKEPPLLIQCRLYKEGYAVKGTLLVNKKVRRSMFKVDEDPTLADRKSFNSLEVVAVSHKPKAAKLSKPLIALLSIGGVPDAYFLGLLESTLKDARRVCSDPRTAFRVANTYQHIDDSGLCIDMFGARIPLNEPYFQYRLSKLAKEERKGLGEGKIPISESFYLIGTADPTGTLKEDQVCVILENGQISGKVLVYRNPGLHFGDIHVLNARYVAELEDYIGNAKYAIFFSTKGRRSVANEIANGDFDGDLYWVSRNPQLLENFKASDPWKRSYSTPSASNKKPSDIPTEELEHELFKLLFSAKEHGWAAGIAADSWMAFMDGYLTLQDDDDQKHLIKNKMLELIDLYYDALDAAKSGKKVVIPHGLRATRFPHHMGRSPEYHSTSVLGLIYDRFQSCKNEKLAVQEIWKLPYFNTSIPPWCLKLWKERYEGYRREMSNALTYNDESKNHTANSVIMKYKQMLYGGRNMEDVYDEALAIYHVSYDYAKSKKDVVKCGFAWKVAGSALCAYHRKIHCLKTGEREITFVSSSFDGVF